MDFGRVIFAIIGFSISTSYFLLIPNTKRWQKKRIIKEKLKIINEAIEEAEQTLERFQDRHDRILDQVCTYYLTCKQLDEAMEDARATMNEALELANTLRRMQLKLISSFPDHLDDQVYDYDE